MELKRVLTLLAVSTGGGVLLGAGMRPGTKRRNESTGASDKPESQGRETEARISHFLKRLEALERRIDAHTTGTMPEAEAFRSPQPGAQRDLQAEINSQIEHVEARLRRDLSHRNDEFLEAIHESFEKRLEKRIEPLETEIASQRSSLSELSDYSLRTERNMQKLLEGVERLVATHSSRSNGTGSDSPHLD